MYSEKIKFEKTICFIIIIAIGFICTIAPVSAKTTSTSYSGQFNKAWQKTKTDTGQSDPYAVKLTYGYNTKLINEDYTWTMASRYAKKHTAYVKNGSGVWRKGPTKGQFVVSKIEVRHKGSKVYYKCVWDQ